MKNFIFLLLSVLSGVQALAQTAASPTPSATLNLPCVTDAGAIANAAPADVCKAILPKCTDVKKQLIQTVKDQLSLKIWGFYNGKNIDPNLSTKSSLVGPATANTVCSVVGQTLKYTNDSTLELTQQMIGSKLSCGLRPNLKVNSDHRTATFDFSGNQGNLWSSYMLGVYPWLMRRYASDVFTLIKDDLSNIDAIVNSPSASADAATTAKFVATAVQGLSAAAKSVCLVGRPNLVSDCTAGTLTVNDPALKICTLVQSQTLTSTGAIPNIIQSQIMTRVQNYYDSKVAVILKDASPDFTTFKNSCGVSRGLFSSKEHGMSCLASCVFDGQKFSTSDNTFIVHEFDGSHKANGCNNSSMLKMSGDYSTVSGGNLQGGSPYFTSGHGFAGFIEKMIRTDICQQKLKTDTSVCDSVNIPSEPSS
jgi:hypothetical protein